MAKCSKACARGSALVWGAVEQVARGSAQFAASGVAGVVLRSTALACGGMRGHFRGLGCCGAGYTRVCPNSRPEVRCSCLRIFV